jgi:hypothetical protein
MVRAWGPAVTAPPAVGADHEHAWSVREVEFAEGGPVQELECSLCGEVSFR